MKGKKIAALALALALLMGALVAALADGLPDATDTYCPYNALGTHFWSDWRTTRQPTCTDSGSESRECLECHYRQTRKIAKKGHAWGKWETVKEPTCAETGEETRKCKVCGKKDTREIEKKPHDYGEWTVTREATCVETGSRTRACRDCGYVDEGVIDLLPHSWDEWEDVVAATDHSAGTRRRVCRVCSAEETEDYDPEGTMRRGDRGDAVKRLQEGLICWGALSGRADGDFGRATEAAVAKVQQAEGLTADGVAWPQTQARLGHAFGDWETVSELSDLSMGLRQRVCARCGYVEKEEEWPAPMYRRGDRGDGVKQLQEALNAAGYDCGRADGDFGGRTEKAVKALESDNGIEPDGIAWPGVLKLLGIAGNPLALETAESPLQLAFDGYDGGVNLTVGGIKSAEDGAARIEVTPGSITHTGSGEDETILVEIVVENIGSAPVNIVEGIALNDGRAATQSDMLRVGSGDGPQVKDSPVALDPGETAVLWLNTAPGSRDHTYGAFYRTVEVVAFPQDYEAPKGKLVEAAELYAHIVADTCVLFLPLNPEPGQKLRLTQGNVSVAGQGLEAEITVALRAENLTDEPLSVSMRHYDPAYTEYDAHFVEWLGEGWGLFTLGPREALDFGVLLRPFPGEVKEGYVSRWLKAVSMDEQETYATLDVSFPLGENRGLTVEGAAGEDSFAPGDMAFHAHLTAVNGTPARLQSARFLGEVLGKDGRFLRALELAPAASTINAYGSVDAELECELTEEEAAEGEITFLVWACAEFASGNEGTLVPMISDNIWRHTVRIGGEPDQSGAAGLSVDASLVRGDVLYTPGGAIPVDITVTAQGSRPLASLEVWLEPLYEDSGMYIYDFASGETFVDTTDSANGGLAGLEPGQPWTRRHGDLTLPMEVARLGAFDLRVVAAARVPETGAQIEASTLLHVRTVDNDAGMVLVLEADRKEYKPNVPITYRVGVRNEGQAPLEDVRVYCRRGTEEQANVQNWAEVVMEPDAPIQPGETAWREDFLCWPTAELQGGDMIVHFTAHAGYGVGHPVSERYLVYALAGDEDAGEGSLAFTATTKAAGFLPGYPVIIELKAVNAGEKDLFDLSFYACPGADADAGDAERELVKRFSGPTKPGQERRTTYTFLPAETDAGKDELAIPFVAAACNEGESDPSVESRQTVTLVSVGDASIAVSGALDVETYSAGVPVSIPITVLNDGKAPLEEVSVTVVRESAAGTETETFELTDGGEALPSGEDLDFPYSYTPDGSEGEKIVFCCYASARKAGTDVRVENSVGFKLYAGDGEAGAGGLKLTASPGWAGGGPGEGDPITFDLEVKNDTAGPVKNLSVDAWLLDESGGILDDWTAADWGSEALAPGESLSESWNYTVVAGDLARGAVHIRFEASGMDAESGSRVSDGIDCVIHLSGGTDDQPWIESLKKGGGSAKHINLPVDAGGPGDEEDEEDEEDGDGATLEIDRRVVGGSTFEEGYFLSEYINYAFTVTNNAPERIDAVAVFCECAGGTPEGLGTVILDPGESRSFTYAHEVSQADVAAGQVENQVYAVILAYKNEDAAFAPGEIFWEAPATVPTTDRQPDPADRPDTYAVEVTLQEVSQPARADGYRPGEEIAYGITVANPTANTVNAAWIFDELLGYDDSAEYLAGVKLASGQSVTVPCAHVVTEQDVAAGKVETRAYALLAVINADGDVEDVYFRSEIVASVVSGGET